MRHDLCFRDLASRLPHHNRHRYLPCLLVRIPAKFIRMASRWCGIYNFIIYS
jgi:hypothetical protein